MSDRNYRPGVPLNFFRVRESAEEVTEKNRELQALVSAFVAARVLRDCRLTKEQWERACYISGFWEPMFAGRQLTAEDGETLEPLSKEIPVQGEDDG